MKSASLDMSVGPADKEGDKRYVSKSFMAMADEEAKANVNGSDGGPFGCVIVKNGQVVSRAHNRVLVDHDPTAHGEITAIRKAGQALGTHDLSGCELYTSAMPCPMCLSAIIWANIKQVYLWQYR